MTIQHKPYVPASSNIAELSPKAVILGILFGLMFGATTSYLALKVGLTVTASIPIAVLAISLIKYFGHSTILENNIVQTIGSAGESIAAGVAFTLPAFVFLSTGKEYFNYFQIFILALAGGLLGIFFMIPLRRSLIVCEHGRLPYPEGTACADILIAGEKGGSLAKRVFYGLGIAFVYKFLMSILGLWKEVPSYTFSKASSLPNATATIEVAPELLGVGYIIGLRLSAILAAGGVLSAFVLTPLITFLGDSAGAVIAPGSKLISAMSPREIWSQYIRYIGAGAVTFGGIVTMIKSLPTIVSTVQNTLCHVRNKQNGTHKDERTDRDIPLSFVFLGSAALIVFMAVVPTLPVTWFSSILIAIAGFFFVTVSSRIVGMIGTSSNPVSGMIIATLMATGLIFISLGWTGDAYQPIALSVGAIVAIAAANGGATSQDLKTGFLVGATPWKQQVGIMIGAITSSIAVGLTIMMLYQFIGFGEANEMYKNPLPAPQAMLMATIIKGLFSQSLPWTLVLIGMGIALVIELIGINSLAFSVGTYLPLATTAPILAGGIVNYLVKKRKTIRAEEADLETGALYSSGLIAGGALTGIAVAVLIGSFVRTASGEKVSVMDLVNTGIGENLGAFGDIAALVPFVLLAGSLYYFAMKRE